MKANIATQILAFLVVIAFTSGIVLLLVQTGTISVRAEGEQPSVLNTEFLPYGREGYLVLKELKFCSFVDQKFRCFNEKEEFAGGENVYVVFLVQSSTYQGEIMLVRNYRLLDPLGRVLLDVDEKNNYHVEQASGREMENVAFADYFTTGKDYAPGEYTLDVVIDNPLLVKTVTVKKRFTIG